MAIKLVYEGNGRWNVIAKDFLVTHATQGLYDASEDILVRDYQDFFIFHDGGADCVLPEWDYAIYALF